MCTPDVGSRYGIETADEATSHRAECPEPRTHHTGSWFSCNECSPASNPLDLMMALCCFDECTKLECKVGNLISKIL